MPRIEETQCNNESFLQARTIGTPVRLKTDKLSKSYSPDSILLVEPKEKVPDSRRATANASSAAIVEVIGNIAGALHSFWAHFGELGHSFCLPMGAFVSGRIPRIYFCHFDPS
jgi:hypothetical protein